MGKGDKPRKPSVSKTQFDSNWDKAFGKTKKKRTTKKKTDISKWLPSGRIDLNNADC